MQIEPFQLPTITNGRQLRCKFKSKTVEEFTETTKNHNKGSNRCLSESARGPYRLFAAMTNELTGYIDKYLNNTFKFGSNIFIS